MKQFSCRYHRFPPQIIQYAIWLYCRFTLSFRDVEDLLAERGLEVLNSHFTNSEWVKGKARVKSRKAKIE